MKIQFADTFSESLKTLIWHESRIYKFYSFFRYDIGRFIKNVWRFRKALSNHYQFLVEDNLWKDVGPRVQVEVQY